LRNIPLEVPPRRKEAGIGLATLERDEDEVHLADASRGRKTLVEGKGARTMHSDAIAYYTPLVPNIGVAHRVVWLTADIFPRVVE